MYILEKLQMSVLTSPHETFLGSIRCSIDTAFHFVIGNNYVKSIG